MRTKKTKKRSKTTKKSTKSKSDIDAGLFQAMVNHVGDDLVLIRKDGKIVFANRHLARGIGVPLKNIIGQTITKFMKDKRNVRHWQQTDFKKIKNHRKPLRIYAQRITKKGGIRTIEVTAMYMKYNVQEYILSIGRDITDRIQKEEKLKVQEQEEKMKAIMDFVSGTANEIRSPLGSVYYKTKNLLDQYKDKYFEYIGYKEFKNIFQSLGNISEQIKYCHDTANRLVHLGKKKLGIPSKGCSVNSMIKEAIEMIDQQFTFVNVRLKLQLSKTLPLAAIDLIELKQVLMILLTNAVQSMPAGGQIVVKTNKVRGQKAVQIEVRDQGVGIARENLPRVFQPFFTTKQRGLEKSSGLGLSIAYSIIKSYNGDIMLNSNLRKGTEVKVILPAY